MVDWIPVFCEYFQNKILKEFLILPTAPSESMIVLQSENKNHAEELIEKLIYNVLRWDTAIKYCERIKLYSDPMCYVRGERGHI